MDQIAENPQSWNLYGYVRNSPLSLVDPTGQCSVAPNGPGYTDGGSGLFPGPCSGGTIGGSGAGDSASVEAKANRVRDYAAEAQAEMMRLQYDAWRRIQELNRPKADQPLPDIARNVAEGVASNQAVQLVATVSDCTAKQVPFVDDGSVPKGPALVAAGQPWIPTRGKFGGATKGTSVASVVLRKAFPIRMRIPGLTNAGVKATPTLGGFLGRTVPIVGWAWTAYSIGSCVAEGPR